MSQVKLSDEQWTKLVKLLRQDERAYVGDEGECRRFVEAVLWITRSGASWRLLPAEYGRWNTVYKRYSRWCEAGVWERLLTQVSQEPDMEHLLLDSTIVRAHPSAAGAEKKTESRHWVAVEAALAPNCIWR
jgi:transposase